ncbi:MAG: hypothetical protein ACH350_07175 [Parachlamydiaceae bacterium]
MILSYAFYELEPISSLNAISRPLPRKGALLKVSFEWGGTGYADCHPWPELGDLSLAKQLMELAQGNMTALTRSSLWFASLDAKIRFEERGALSSLNPQRSHLLVPDIFQLTPSIVEQMIEKGVTHVKLKMGRCIEHEVKYLHLLFYRTPLKLRLDFNETLTAQSCSLFLDAIATMRENIDFIEDPFAFDIPQWIAIQKEGWMLACDRQAAIAADHPEAAAVLVIKPALHPFEDWKKKGGQMHITTSYLGHPIGQVAAAYVASQIDPSCAHVHGLLSHHVYRPTPFSRQLNWGSPFFLPPPGTGFGFDSELEQIEWLPLSPFTIMQF